MSHDAIEGDAYSNGHGLKDSGQRTTYETGGQRETKNKARLSLLSPISNRMLAKHMERGAIKYAARNWEQGLPLSGFIDGAMRHLDALRMGEIDEPHATAALWNLHCMVHTMYEIANGNLPDDLIDIPAFARFDDKDLMRQVDVCQ